MAGQEVELLVGVKAALTLIHGLHRPEPPRADQRTDPGRPRPLTHAVKDLAVTNIVAIEELLVAKEVSMGVENALRKPGRARGVVELRGVVGRCVERRELG